MKKNISGLDRWIRLAIATIIGLLYLKEIITGTLAYVLLGIGVILILTSLVKFCPLYTLFGINSCRVKKKTS